jgi:hypothetical protein
VELNGKASAGGANAHRTTNVENARKREGVLSTGVWMSSVQIARRKTPGVSSGIVKLTFTASHAMPGLTPIGARKNSVLKNLMKMGKRR